MRNVLFFHKYSTVTFLMGGHIHGYPTPLDQPWTIGVNMWIKKITKPKNIIKKSVPWTGNSILYEIRIPTICIYYHGLIACSMTRIHKPCVFYNCDHHIHKKHKNKPGGNYPELKNVTSKAIIHICSFCHLTFCSFVLVDEYVYHDNQQRCTRSWVDTILLSQVVFHHFTIPLGPGCFPQGRQIFSAWRLTCLKSNLVSRYGPLIWRNWI